MTDLDPLVVGDRVSRPREVVGNLPEQHGIVVEVYLARPSTTGGNLWLYAVEWHGTSYVERGYLRNGLTKVVIEEKPQP